jgi:hypothetical protein
VPTVSDADIAHFRAFGFVVLRQAVDAGPLSEEIDRSLRDGFASAFESNAGGGGIEGHYLPMMCERTPVSLSLLDHLAPLATEVLARPVLPVRAKGILYFGSANWHDDSGHDVGSVGFVCYLDALRAENGALRVLPGSHRPEFSRSVRGYARGRPTDVGDQELDAWVTGLPAYVVDTDPGDVIVMDEHLHHASAGGHNRRQWRVDYVVDPTGTEEESAVRAYFASVFLPDWDGGYDVDRYPTYGTHWLGSGRPWVERLGQLGVYDRAGAEEAFARSRRRRQKDS